MKEILAAGKIILYPTDTVWGLGCDATNYVAVDKIFKIKQRSESKSLIILVSDEQMLKDYVEEIPAEILIYLKNVDRPTTVIYPQAKNLAANVIASDGSVAIRIPQDDFCKSMIENFGKPIVSTSANISGEPTPTFFKEISSSIIEACDFVCTFRQDDETPRQSSRLVRFLSNGKIEVLR